MSRYPRQVQRIIDQLSALPEVLDDLAPEHVAIFEACAADARGEKQRQVADAEWKAKTTPAKPARRPARKPDPPELRAAKVEVHARSGGLCEARTTVCNHYAEHVHHIARRRGKHAHAVANLLDVCQPCHLFLHANPELSYEMGWLVRSGALPPVVNTKAKA